MLNDLYGLRLMHRKLISIVVLVLPRHPDEGLHRKGVVLHGHRKALFLSAVPEIFLLHQLVLLGYLPGIAQKFLPLGGGHDAPVGTHEDLDANFLLQRLDGRTEAGLRDEELLRRLIHGTGIRHGDHLSKLL